MGLTGQKGAQVCCLYRFQIEQTQWFRGSKDPKENPESQAPLVQEVILERPAFLDLPDTQV